MRHINIIMRVMNTPLPGYVEINGWNSRYWINSDGAIYNYNIGNFMVTNKNQGGYFVIGFCLGGKRKNFLVHRLVAEYFLPKVEGKNFINHKDGNRENNKVENLEWCTHQENINHAIKMGLIDHSAITEKQKNNGKRLGLSRRKYSDEQIKEFRKMKSKGFTISFVAKRFGVNRSTMRDILSGVHYSE